MTTSSQIKKLQKWIVLWWEASKANYTSAALLPVALAGLMAASKGEFNPALFSLTFVGVGMLALGCYLINNYFDYKTGVDAKKLKYFDWSLVSSVRDWNPIVTGRLKAESILYASLACFAVVLPIGIYLMVKVDYVVFILGFVGFLIAYFYSAPPVDLSSRALGEIFPGIAFGPLVMIGTYYVLTKSFSLETGLISIPVGVFVSLIRWVDAIPGYEAHKTVGEKKLTTVLGPRRAIACIPLFFATIYLTIIAGVATNILPPLTLLGLLSLPIAVKVIIISRRSEGDPNRFAKAITVTLLSFVATLMLLMISYILYIA